MNKKGFLFCAFVILTFVFGYVKAEVDDYATLGYSTPNGYSYWRVDSSGYLKPGVASTLDIGTSALPVRNLYVGGITATGTQTLSGGITNTGAVTFNAQVYLMSMSSTTIATATPGKVGALVYNTSRAALCVGTATVAGSWIFMSTNPITEAQVSCKE